MNKQNPPVIKKTLSNAELQRLFPLICGVSKEGRLFSPPDLQNAYMWNAESQEGQKKTSDFTEQDKRFLLDPSTFKKELFYGYHDYGGYWGLFKPSLNEVIELIHSWWQERPLIKQIYVRTRAYPSNNVNACFNSALDRHLGCTEVWWEEPEVPVPPQPEETKEPINPPAYTKQPKTEESTSQSLPPPPPFPKDIPISEPPAKRCKRVEIIE